MSCLQQRHLLFDSRYSGQWAVLSYLTSSTGSGTTDFLLTDCRISSVLDLRFDGRPTVDL